eukprot:7376489-Prymnesium_polylepis.1
MAATTGSPRGLAFPTATRATWPTDSGTTTGRWHWQCRARIRAGRDGLLCVRGQALPNARCRRRVGAAEAGRARLGHSRSRARRGDRRLWRRWRSARVLRRVCFGRRHRRDRRWPAAALLRSRSHLPPGRSAAPVPR